MRISYLCVCVFDDLKEETRLKCVYNLYCCRCCCCCCCCYGCCQNLCWRYVFTKPPQSFVETKGKCIARDVFAQRVKTLNELIKCSLTLELAQSFLSLSLHSSISLSSVSNQRIFFFPSVFTMLHMQFMQCISVCSVSAIAKFVFHQNN